MLTWLTFLAEHKVNHFGSLLTTHENIQLKPMSVFLLAYEVVFLQEQESTSLYS